MSAAQGVHNQYLYEQKGTILGLVHFSFFWRYPLLPIKTTAAQNIFTLWLVFHSGGNVFPNVKTTFKIDLRITV
jgi:hypothetical protein